MKARVALALVTLVLTVAYIYFSYTASTEEKPNAFIEITTPGAFGPAGSTEIIVGDIIIKVSGVTLRNLAITGNVYFTVSRETGNDVLSLDNVTVEGIMAARTDSLAEVILRNSRIGELSVTRGNGVIRVLAENGTEITGTRIYAAASIVEKQESEAPGFISVSIKTTQPVELNANLDTLYLLHPGTQVSITGGTVSLLVVAENAENADLLLDRPATIHRLELHAPVRVRGDGTVESAWLQAGVSSFATMPKALDFASDDVRNSFTERTREATAPPATPVTTTPTKPVILYAMDLITVVEGESATATVGSSPAAGVTFTATSANENIARASMTENVLHVSGVSPGATKVIVLASHPDYQSGSASYPVAVQAKAQVQKPTVVFTADPTGTVFTLSTLTDGATIFFTTDNATPTVYSQLYIPGITYRMPPGDFVLKAVAVKNGMRDSEIAVFYYSEPIPDSPDEETPD